MRNLHLRPLKLTSWRKIALGTWNNGGDPSVYGTLELHATKIAQRNKQYEARGAKPPTITTTVTRATALTLEKYPQINGMVRWGKIYNRSEINVFLQTAVDEAGSDLSGLVIERANHKSLAEISSELSQKAKAIREGRDEELKKTKANFGIMPAFLVRYVLNFVSFLMYTLNLNLKPFGLPKDPFGSVMITSVGSLGIDGAFAPLVPYSRVPLLLAVGIIKDAPSVVDGKLAIAPILKIYVTFDHRFMDGVLAAKMAKHMRYLLESDDGLDELGLR